MTDASFERIDDDDSTRVGPPALLLSGFASEEVPTVEALLRRIGATDHGVRRCSEAMLAMTLQQALTTEAPGEPVPADQLPRVAVLSGLTGRQINATLDGWKDTGLARPLWASTTPNNLEFPVRVLLKELLAEQHALAASAATPPEPPPKR